MGTRNADEPRWGPLTWGHPIPARRTTIQALCVIVPWALVFCLVLYVAQFEGRNRISESPALVLPSDRRLELVDSPGDHWCEIWCPAALNTAPAPPAVCAPCAAPAPTNGQQAVVGAAAAVPVGKREVEQMVKRTDLISHVGEPGWQQQEEKDPALLLTERVIASMTLGAVAFQMSLFYIVNHRDDDIKRYSLSVIGQTISIFCAVLTFNALFSVVERYMEHVNQGMQVLITPVFILFFLFVMEVIVQQAARVRGDEAKKHKNIKFNKRLKVQLSIPTHVLNAKTFGTGAAQMCAVATMRGFGHLQLLAYDSEHSFFMVCAVCPLAFWGLFSAAWMISWLRAKIIRYDGVIDDAEWTWIEVAEECEDEVIALSCGFFCAVAARVAITDSLPFLLLHGFEHRGSLESARLQDVIILWAVGIACALACISMNWVAFGILKHGINREKLRSDSVSRLIRVFTMSIGMMFAWCTCFATHLFALHLPGSKEGLQLRLVIALFQSIATFFVVCVLDFFADMKCAGPAFDKALIMIICALGASVGLAWEQAFHVCAEVAVEFMAEDTTTFLFRASNDPQVWALVLSSSIVIIVWPAFLFYIVPRMYQMVEEHDNELKVEEQHYRQSMMMQGKGEALISENLFMWEDGGTQIPMADDAFPQRGDPRQETMPLRGSVVTIASAPPGQYGSAYYEEDENNRRGSTYSNDYESE